MKAYNKSILREFKQSSPRFLSILAIIFLGVSFYVGIRSTGPDMVRTAENYYNKQQLMDLQINSTYGFVQEDINSLQDIDTIKYIQPGYHSDINQKKESKVVRVLSLPEQENLNKLNLIEGRLPKENNEIVLDAKEQVNFKLNDTYHFQSDDSLLINKEYKIVGFANSPLFVSSLSRGYTTVGNGEIAYFAYVKEANFKQDVYTDIYIGFNNTTSLNPYSSEYKKLIKKNTKEVEKVLELRADARLSEIQAPLKEELTNSKTSLDAAKLQLDQGKLQLQALGLTEDDIAQQMAPQLEEYAKNEALYTQSLNDINAMELPTYYTLDRNSETYFSEFYDNTKRVSSIADIVPIFFFGIAALISLTTMTRMVEEKRSEIGALKALGYRNSEIAKKFLIYAAIATIAGSVLGILIGAYIFPTIIYNAYSQMYNIPNLAIQFIPIYMIHAVSLSFLCTFVATYVVLRASLKESASSLMLAKAPKIGKKILLERIPILWNRFNFSFKVTFRNIFRYKQRMFMTIIGIAGCTGLMLTGFGLRNSVEDVSKKQFDNLWTYDASLILNDAKEHAEKDVNAYLKKNGIADETLSIYKQEVDVKDLSSSYVVDLYVVDNTQDANFNSYIHLQNRKTKETYSIDKDGVVINEKLALTLNVKVGDSIQIKNDKQYYKVPIIGISESYIGNQIYMNSSFYKQVNDTSAKPNTLLFKTDLTKHNKDNIASNLIETGNVVNVSYLSGTMDFVNDAMSSINMIVIVLIVSAGLLAFVVLYNLSNINVSERIRELSTIKVLGFYDKEVTAYIYRENIILSVLGILFGFLVGIALHQFVIRVVTVNNFMLSQNIHASSYIFSAILTSVFTLIVMFIMHRKLKYIKMMDALKSVD